MWSGSIQRFPMPLLSCLIHSCEAESHDRYHPEQYEDGVDALPHVSVSQHHLVHQVLQSSSAGLWTYQATSFANLGFRESWGSQTWPPLSGQSEPAASHDDGAGQGKEAPPPADEAGNRMVMRVVAASTTMS